MCVCTCQHVWVFRQSWIHGPINILENISVPWDRMPVQWLTQVRNDYTCIKAGAVGRDMGAALHRHLKGTLNLRVGEREKLRKILGLLAWGSGTRSIFSLTTFWWMLLSHLSEPQVPNSSWNTRAKTDHQILNHPFIPIFKRGNIFKFFFQVSLEACPHKSVWEVFTCMPWAKSPYQWLWGNVDLLNYTCRELNNHLTTWKRDLLYNLVPRVGQSNYYWL